MCIVLLALSTVSVNLFFLMSGYFHSRFRLGKLIELLVMASVYSCIDYAVICLLGYHEFSVLGLGRRFILGLENYWFLVAYIVIYCFSPYIVRLLDSLQDNEIRKLVLVYGIINTILGFILDDSVYGSAFSVLPMMFVYILGYYIGRCGRSFKIRKVNLNGISYLAISAIIAGFALILLYFGKQKLAYRVLCDYRNPLLIISACGLFLFFKNDVRIKNMKLQRAISWVAVSVFAIYLITDCPDVHYYIFTPLTRLAGNNISIILMIGCIVAYIVGMSIVCIMVDKVRKEIHMKISYLVYKKYNVDKKID